MTRVPNAWHVPKGISAGGGLHMSVVSVPRGITAPQVQPIAHSILARQENIPQVRNLKLIPNAQIEAKVTFVIRGLLPLGSAQLERM
jgi:hypothetical protein